MELETTQSFFENILQQSVGLDRADRESWYGSNFGRYVYKHERHTQDSWEDLRYGES